MLPYWISARWLQDSGKTMLIEKVSVLSKISTANFKKCLRMTSKWRCLDVIFASDYTVAQESLYLTSFYTNNFFQIYTTILTKTRYNILFYYYIILFYVITSLFSYNVVQKCAHERFRRWIILWLRHSDVIIAIAIHVSCNTASAVPSIKQQQHHIIITIKSIFTQMVLFHKIILPQQPTSSSVTTSTSLS